MGDVPVFVVEREDVRRAWRDREFRPLGAGLGAVGGLRHGLPVLAVPVAQDEAVDAARAAAQFHRPGALGSAGRHLDDG